MLASVVIRWPGSEARQTRTTAQAALPVSAGGVGLRSTALHAPAAFLGGWASVAALLRRRFTVPADAVFLAAVDGVDDGELPFRQDLKSACGWLPPEARPLLPSMARTVSTKLQESLSTKVDARVLAVFEDGATTDDTARRLSASGVGAGAWLTTMPLFPALQLSADVFRTALRIRLGLPHPILAAVERCLCGVTLTTEGTHLLRCPVGRGRTATHDALRDEVYVILRDAGYVVSREQTGFMPIRPGETHGRRIDLVASEPGRDRRWLLDVTVTAPGQRPGGAAKEAEQAKRRKYADHPPTDEFIPLAAETQGTLGGAFNALLAKCARQAVYTRGLALGRLGGFVAMYRQRVACALQRAQALALLERGAAAVAAVPGWAPLRTVPPTAEEDAVLAGAAERG
eukprot:jgi/Chlat1/1489/Chrsp12S00110